MTCPTDPKRKIARLCPFPLGTSHSWGQNEGQKAVRKGQKGTERASRVRGGERFGDLVPRSDSTCRALSIRPAAPEPGQVTAGGVSPRLTATADTWFEIRSGSADGDVLYSGIPPAGQHKALPEHAIVGVIRCRLEPHSALERKAAAPAARHLHRFRRCSRPAATRRLGPVHER
jgi:hypothetical protein